MPLPASSAELADLFGLVTLVASPVLADDAARRLRAAPEGRAAALLALLRERAGAGRPPLAPDAPERPDPGATAGPR